uniref:Uncharacterized protein n=1 Tax=Globodera rostochiensis TaxID=31243 RepID=A0A914I748_GLORO
MAFNFSKGYGPLYFDDVTRFNATEPYDPRILAAFNDWVLENRPKPPPTPPGSPPQNQAEIQLPIPVIGQDIAPPLNYGNEPPPPGLELENDDGFVEEEELGPEPLHHQNVVYLPNVHFPPPPPPQVMHHVYLQPPAHLPAHQFHMAPPPVGQRFFWPPPPPAGHRLYMHPPPPAGWQQHRFHMPPPPVAFHPVHIPPPPLPVFFFAKLKFLNGPIFSVAKCATAICWPKSNCTSTPAQPDSSSMAYETVAWTTGGSASERSKALKKRDDGNQEFFPI